MSRFNLRKRARVCYYEPEEPPFDEYVFCTECRDYVYEYCSIHGPLLVIPDDKVGAVTGFPAFVPRAALTVPRVFLHLAYSRIPEAGLGVFSTLTLPIGVRFGPYRGQHVKSIGDSTYGWQIYDRDHKPLHIVDARDANNSNWMRYVNCSRHHAEQNLVAYQYQGELYYRTVKVVPRFTELLVFYGSEFANWLGVDLRGYRGPCPCPACQAQLAQKKDPVKTNKRKAPVEQKIEKPSEEKNTKLPEPSTSSQDDLPSKVGIQDISPESPTASNSSSKTNIVNGGTEFKCGQCGKSFNVKSDLQKHIHTHMLLKESIKASKDYTCSSCSCKFDTKLLLLEHAKSQHGGKYFCCNVCEYATEYAHHLKAHLRTHTGEKPYKCSHCSASFARSGNLQRHLKTHSGEKPYKCSHCSSSFTESGTLQRHLRTHTGEKPYKCSHCSASFAQSAPLQKHLRTHTGEKPYKCSHCSASFAQSGTLQKHLRTHTGEKPYECNICDYKTTQSGVLKCHLMSRHSGQKPFACDACSYRGATRNHLRSHMKHYHKSA